MNPGYNRVYTPVIRSPLLFRQNTMNSYPSYYPNQRAANSSTSSYSPYPSSYSLPPNYTPQAPLPYYTQTYPQSYPYYPVLSVPTVPSSIPFSSYSVPNFTYTPTASSKGLALILIATLILVALDLMIVRPQKQLAH